MTNVWPLGLFDCVTYRDPVNHRNHFFPNFCPQGGPRSIVITSRFHLLTLLILRNIHIFLLALFGQCCIEGEIYTILNDQTPCCLNMSGGGWMCCLMTLPPAIFGPFGGLFVNVCCGVRTRQEIMKKYDMLPEPSRYNMTHSLILCILLRKRTLKNAISRGWIFVLTPKGCAPLCKMLDCNGRSYKARQFYCFPSGKIRMVPARG